MSWSKKWTKSSNFEIHPILGWYFFQSNHFKLIPVFKKKKKCLVELLVIAVSYLSEFWEGLTDFWDLIHQIAESSKSARYVVVNDSVWLLLLLTLSWRRPLSYKNQSIDLFCKSMDWFLYDNGLRHDRAKLTVICGNTHCFVRTFHYTSDKLIYSWCGQSVLYDQRLWRFFSTLPSCIFSFFVQVLE